VLPEK